jgi:hypothetical protein
MAGMLTPLVVLLGVSLIVVKPREGGWRREKALGGGQLASHIWPKPGQIWSTNAFMRMVAGKGSRWRAACFPQLANDGPDMGHQCFGVDGGGKSSSAAGGEAGQAAGSLLPASGEATADRVLGEQRLMLMISLAACCSLVQYPFPYVTYFCYTAPLTLLAVVAAVAMRREAQGNTLRDTPGRTQGKFLLAALLLFYLGYGFVGMVPKHVYNPDLHRRGELRALRLPRAGGLKIDVTSSHVDGTTTLYEELIPFLQEHAANGLMYAGNDCPELYFLSGLKNPTSNDTGAPESEVLMALRSGELRLVVINDKTFFASGSTSAELREEIAQRLPNVAKRGRFSIYWR